MTKDEIKDLIRSEIKSKLRVEGAYDWRNILELEMFWDDEFITKAQINIETV